MEPVTPALDEEAKPDTPFVAELKKLDDLYLDLEKEMTREINAMTRKYTEMQKPFLDQRTKVLAGDGTAADTSTGTPALKGFWLKALKNHPALEEMIEKWDAEVLEFLKDITCKDLDPDDEGKGFRMTFHFAANPYFDNAVLSKEYRTKQDSTYSWEVSAFEVSGCSVNWKEGKNVTVALVKKKVKGGGAKKSKQAKERAEPRSSFFRSFFTRNLKEGGRLPEDVDAEDLAAMCQDEKLDEGKLLAILMDQDHGVGLAIRDNVIPFAVRWYTGEAAPKDDDDGGEEEGEGESSSDDDDDEGAPPEPVVEGMD